MLHMAFGHLSHENAGISERQKLITHTQLQPDLIFAFAPGVVYENTWHIS